MIKPTREEVIKDCQCINCNSNGYEGCPKCDAEEKLLKIEQRASVEVLEGIIWTAIDNAYKCDISESDLNIMSKAVSVAINKHVIGGK